MISGEIIAGAHKQDMPSKSRDFRSHILIRRSLI
jgi:hypothetical protein